MKDVLAVVAEKLIPSGRVKEDNIDTWEIFKWANGNWSNEKMADEMKQGRLSFLSKGMIFGKIWGYSNVLYPIDTESL